MKKQTTTKIIQKIFIFVFIVFVFQISSPVFSATGASIGTDTSIGNYYSNPNQGGNNPYKFKIKDVVNSDLLTSIVGCTGTVNKISEWMSRFMQSPLKMGKFAKEEIAKKKKQLSDACGVVKAGMEAAGDSIPTIGGLSPSIGTKLESKVFCRAKIAATSDEEIQKMIDEEKATTSRDFKEQCFDGIAITLARNQLTAMTRSAMNWVNSGYGGNPFFVQSMRNLTTGIERNVIETGIDILLSPDGEQSPYARNFAESTIYSQGLTSSSTRFLGSLTSSLENFVTDPSSYYSNSSLDKAQDTRNALQRAQDANNIFANNFSSGGWNAWLALTQREQNNPLGFNMLASQYLADEQYQKTSETRDELLQNNGFLSQKVCVNWQMYDKKGKAKTQKGASLLKNGQAVSSVSEFVFVSSEPRYLEPDGEHEYGKCIEWKTITPGSIIRDKTTNYLNSPERQLELSKTINDSLNALFSVLISKLQGGGLSGLSNSVVKTNWTDNLNTFTSADGNSTYDNNGAYDGFNLTRDLGNTYIHEDAIKLGTWDARACPFGQEDRDTCNTATTTNKEYAPKDEDNRKIKLYPNIAPEVYKIDPEGKTKLLDNKLGDIYNPVNGYYLVTTPGKTKIISEGYNGWEEGDRAFWDGNEWQNWKKGQASAIDKRGVIQIQQDYIVAAKEMLKVLPGIMPALGELDYCLPGPNPNYKINSSDAQTAFNNWIGSSYIGATDTSGERYGVKIDIEGDATFEDLQSIYQNNNIWSSVLTEKVGDIKYNGETADLSMVNVIKIFSNMCNDKQKESLSGITKLKVTALDVGKYLINPLWSVVSIFKNSAENNCTGNYTYAKNGDLGDNQSYNLNYKTQLQEYLVNYTGSYLFNKFYEIFDEEMNKQYFKKMTDRYIEKENEPVSTINYAYIPMAESGFEFTKNIMSYADDTIKAENDYADAISKAKTNISKLDPIRNDVSVIIKAAQDRRDKNLTRIINEESVRTGRKNAEGKPYVLTEAQYKKEYQDCLEEENIQVFDIESILDTNDKRGEEACSDGVDNDLDGLIDNKDPDCGPTRTIRSPMRITDNPSEGAPYTSTENYAPASNYLETANY